MDLLLKRSESVRSAAAAAAAVIVFALLTCAGTFVRVPLPFTPVPLTFQTFVVLLSGAFLGTVAGPASQMMYLVFGAGGLAVFANPGFGSLYFCGPTGGYLAGFVLASLFVGMAVKRAAGFRGVCLAFLCGSALILACGTLWLAFVSRVSLSAAFSAGFVPFIPGDALKSVCAAIVFIRARKLSF